MWPETLDDYPKPLSLGQLLKQKLQQNCSQQHEVLLASSQCTLAEVDFSKVENRIHITGLRQPQKQEPQMDIQKLIALADPSWEKDMKELGILSESIAADELRAEIEAQSKERRSSDIKQAASQILELGRSITKHKEMLVNDLRHIRAREKAILKEIASAEEAWNYGSKTLNYLPAALLIGVTYAQHLPRGIDPELLKVKPVEQAGVGGMGEQA